MTATKAFLAGIVLLAGLVVLALSVGAQGFGWGDGGSLVLLRTPRVLAALAAGLALGVSFWYCDHNTISLPFPLLAGKTAVNICARTREMWG